MQNALEPRVSGENSEAQEGTVAIRLKVQTHNFCATLQNDQ